MRAEKLRQEQEKKDRLEARLAAEQKKASELLRLQSIDPVDMFRCGEFGEVGEFKEFDERGIPTVLADGTPVSKSRRKKLEKEWDRQSKLFIKKE